MSAKGTFWAWEQVGLSSSQKLVLLCLGDCHNADSGLCYPSAKYISTRTGLNKKTVYSALSQLRKMGLISPVKDHDKSTKYELMTQKRYIPKSGLASPNIGSIHDPKTGHKPTIEPTKEPTKEDESKNQTVDEIRSTLFEGWKKLFPNRPQPMEYTWRAGSNHYKNLKARIFDHPNHQQKEFWVRYLRAVSKTEWYGPNQTGSWHSLSWFVKKENFEKVLEKIHESL